MEATTTSIPGTRCHPYDVLTDVEAIGVIDDPVALVEVGACEYEGGRWEEGRLAFEKASRLDPLHPDAWHGLLKLFFHTGGRVVTVDDLRLVAERLEEAAPADPLSVCMSALFLNAGGEKGKADGMIAGALMGYRSLSSSFSATPLCLGYYLSFSDDPSDREAALDLLDEAALLDPTSAAPDRYRGMILSNANRCGEAVVALQTSLGLYDASRRTWKDLAEVYFYNCPGLEFLAESALLLSLEGREAQASDLYLSAQIAAMHGDPVEAEALFAEAVLREPQDPSYQVGLAFFYLSQGRHEEALSLWEDLDRTAESQAEREDLVQQMSGVIYDDLSEIIASAGWTYACEEDAVEKWREVARLSGLILAMDGDDPYALYLRGRSGWRLSSCSPDADASVDEAVSDLGHAIAHSSPCGETFLLKLFNERGLALMRMSGLLFGRGEVDGAGRIAALARADFERVIEGGPKKGEATIAAREAVEATLSLGWLHYANGEYDAARRQFSDVADERIWPSPPTSSKERAEGERALGLIAYRSGKQLFHRAEKSDAEGEYQAAAAELGKAVGHFRAAAEIERRAAEEVHYFGTAQREGRSDVERVLLDALDWYLSRVYPEERLDTAMNGGFAEYFLGRALKEKPHPDTQEGIAHLDAAVRLLGEVLDAAPENPEMLRFRGSALIARGSYHAGVDDIIASVRHGTRFVDNALAKAVVAARELIALTDNASYTDYDNQARRLFRRLAEETDVCGKRLKKEVLDLRKPLLDHAKRCDPQFFSDLFSCIERYGGEGRRLVRSLKRGCPTR